MSEVERYKPYKGVAACGGALIAVTETWMGSENAFKNIEDLASTPFPLTVHAHPEAGLHRLYRPSIQQLAEYRAAVHQPLVPRITTL